MPGKASNKEYHGYTKAEHGLNFTSLYDPYNPEPTSPTNPTPKYRTKITTDSKITFYVQSSKRVVRNNTEYLELTVFDIGIEQQGYKEKLFTTVKIDVPQGGTGRFVANIANLNDSNTTNVITWNGNSKGKARVHAYFNYENQNYLILKDISITSNLEYNPIEATTFTQGAVTATLISPPNEGRSNIDNYLYTIEGANVYTMTPGDTFQAENGNYTIASVEDVEDFSNTFYIFDINTVRRRIFGQQDGIYYLTCLRGDIRPFPTGAGVGENFRNFKFSQPVSKLYPEFYKNDPEWYKQLDASAIDPPATISAADNYVHGLVTVNDSKSSVTKEGVLDLIKDPGSKRYTFTGSNQIKATSGLASAGSEARKISIAGDSLYPTEGRLYVELRRPSIARSGNHTFEYLGFGPGNYSTGFPARQEVVLTDIQDFYAQAKRENGGIVFYTGLNSNGDLYIGNRKINAITGEETFLESAQLVESSDDSDAIGNFVTTFDGPVTFNDIVSFLAPLNKGPNQFTSPIYLDVGTIISTTGLPAPPAIQIKANISTADDPSLRINPTTTRDTGDIILSENRLKVAVIDFNPRGLQDYSIRTALNQITPDQLNTFGLITNNTSQVVGFGSKYPLNTGDIILKGEQVGLSGSLAWVYANNFQAIVGSNLYQLSGFGSGINKVRITWSTISGTSTRYTNAQVGIASTNYQVKITGTFQNSANVGLTSKVLGAWSIDATTFVSTNTYVDILLNNYVDTGTYDISVATEPTIIISLSNVAWKEVGVIGAESIRTNTNDIGDYKVGINTVARASHLAYKNGFVESGSTDPRANLDVVGTAFISGKTLATTPNNFIANQTLGNRTFNNQKNALLVGGDSNTPDNKATLRVSTIAREISTVNYNVTATPTVIQTYNVTITDASFFTLVLADNQTFAAIDTPAQNPNLSNVSAGTILKFRLSLPQASGGLIIKAGSLVNAIAGAIGQITTNITLANNTLTWDTAGVSPGEYYYVDPNNANRKGAIIITASQSYYYIDGVPLSQLTHVAGTILRFTIGLPGNPLPPFWIKTKRVIGDGDAVTTGIATGGNGLITGILTWDTDGVSPGEYYYINQNNISMSAIIKITPSPIQSGSFSGRVGINVTNTELDRNLVVDGNARITSDFELTGDLQVNGGDLTTSSNFFNLLNTSSLNILNLAAEAEVFNIGHSTNTDQVVNLGNNAAKSYLQIGNAATETVLKIHRNSSNAIVEIASVADTIGNNCDVIIGGAWNNTNSKTEIRTRQTLLAGELEFGTRYAPGTSQSRIFTQTRVLNAFDGDQTNTVNLATNATTFNLGSVGGNTTIRNTLNVLASTNVNGNIKLNGGLNAGIVEITRGRFNTTPIAHNIGSLATTNIDFYKYTTTGRVIDTQGVSQWGTTAFLVAGGQIVAIDTIVNTGGANRTPGVYSFAVADGGTGAGALFNIIIANDRTLSIQIVSPGSGYTDNDLLTIQASSIGGGNGAGTLTFQVNGTQSGGSNYALPISTPGVFDFAIGDLVLIDRGNAASPDSIGNGAITGLRNQANSEIVRVTGLTNLSNANDPQGYRIQVSRGQEGTQVRLDHPDGCVLAKLVKQSNASFITGADINNDGVVDIPAVGIGATSSNVNIGVAEFGGVITTNDYLRLTASEIVGIARIVATDIQVLEVNDGSTNPASVFKVESTSGNTIIGGNLGVGTGFNRFTVDGPTGNTAIAGTLTTENTLTINGSTTLNTQFFTITNGGATGIPLRTTFQIDTATGDLRLNGGNINVFGTDGTTPRLTFANSSGDFTTYGSFSALGTGTSTFGGDILAAGDLTLNGGDITVNSGGVSIFEVNNDGSLRIAKINNYITRTGGRTWQYKDSNFTAESNINYFVNATGSTLVKLPLTALIGDMIRIIDIGGSLNYNLSLVIRAPDGVKIQNAADNTGSTLITVGAIGAGYGGGELVVQTPGAAFGLVYAGTATPEGNSAVPSSIAGWYLIEV